MYFTTGKIRGICCTGQNIRNFYGVFGTDTKEGRICSQKTIFEEKYHCSCLPEAKIVYTIVEEIISDPYESGTAFEIVIFMKDKNSDIFCR